MNAVRLEDLLKLRAMQDRLVSVAVLRGEWDYAAVAAKESERYDGAIKRLMLTAAEQLAADLHERPQETG